MHRVRSGSSIGRRFSKCVIQSIVERGTRQLKVVRFVEARSHS